MVPPGYRLPLSLRTSAHAGVAIRFPLLRPVSVPVTKERTDCHVAALLAMTGGGRTLAAQNDHFLLQVSEKIPSGPGPDGIGGKFR